MQAIPHLGETIPALLVSSDYRPVVQLNVYTFQTSFAAVIRAGDVVIAKHAPFDHPGAARERVSHGESVERLLNAEGEQHRALQAVAGGVRCPDVTQRGTENQCRT